MRAEIVETRSQVDMVYHWAPIPVTTTRHFHRETTTGAVLVETHVDRPVIYEGPVSRLSTAYHQYASMTEALSTGLQVQIQATLTQAQYAAMPGVRDLAVSNEVTL